jgi:hypothetical protein
MYKNEDKFLHISQIMQMFLQKMQKTTLVWFPFFVFRKFYQSVINLRKLPFLLELRLVYLCFIIVL